MFFFPYTNHHCIQHIFCKYFKISENFTSLVSSSRSEPAYNIVGLGGRHLNQSVNFNTYLLTCGRSQIPIKRGPAAMPCDRGPSPGCVHPSLCLKLYFCLVSFMMSYLEPPKSFGLTTPWAACLCSSLLWQIRESLRSYSASH